MQTSWIKARQTRYTAYFAAYLLIILAALGAANWLAQRHNKSLDTTANKKFSLSEQTEKVVKGLAQDVVINYYDRTSQFTTARDLLDRYGNLSTKLSVVFVDPDKKPQLAKAAGIRSYGTIQIKAGAKTEEAKSLSEEEITGALIRALKTGERNACFVSGSGEHGLDDTGRSGYSNAKEALEKNNYKTRTVSLLAGGAGDAPAPDAKKTVTIPEPGKEPIGGAAAGKTPEVPKDCTVLIIGGPKYDYLEPSVKAIKAHVEGGGRAMLLLDPGLKLGREDNSGSPALVAMLGGWGVTVNKDLAVDTSGVGSLFGLSEVIPLVTTYESHPIVREMKEVATAFPLTRTIDVKSEGKATAEKLFSTSGNSFATTNLSSAEIRIDPAKDKKGPLAIAAAGTYKDAKEGRFVVVGSSNFIGNNIFRFNGNRDLFLNMMNWLSSDEDLISIRPKDPEDRRLTLSRGQMSRIFFSSVVGLPLIVIASGLMVWWKRR